MRNRVIAVLLTLLIVVSSISTGFAAVCLREVTVKVNGKYVTRACNKAISWVYSGNSVEQYSSHQFGGFLGLFMGTCNYSYRDHYSHYQCKSGHVQNMRTERKTYNHSSCGQ